MASKKSTVEIALDFPIKIEGVECSRLTLRRPKVGDMLAAEEGSKGQSEQETEILAFANLCMVTPAEIRDLDLGDYKKLQKAFSGFLG
ncbi:MAG: phage tail assembly protein [bacterium]|jgi:hypothetical protein